MCPSRSSVWLLVAAAGAACTGGGGNSPADSPEQGDDTTAAVCEPIEARAPNGRDQRPAFAGQTRACRIDSGVAFDVEVITDELVHPWAVEPLPGGELLVSERPGRLRIISTGGRVGDPIVGLPPVDARGQGGLLDVALSPSFESDRTIYWSYAEPRQDGNGTSVARGVLSADGRSLSNVEVIVRTMPTYAGSRHFGSRLAFAPDGMLYITLGDRSDARMRPHAQRLESHLGKILRVAPDGSIPSDNPFVGRDDARGAIWTLGHRNVQSAAFDPDGRLWVVEHGTRGGDELNLIEPGENYGWPTQAYGIEYSGRRISGASTAPPGYQQPVYYWDPVIAPSGAEFYTGDAFPEWQGSLFVGALRGQRLVRLTLADGTVTGEEHLLADRGQRIRDVRQGPDGALYVVTDEEHGAVWRITPRRGGSD